MALKWTAYGPRRVISVQHCTATAALEGDVERNGLSTLGRQFFAESRSQEGPEKHKCVS